VRTTIRKARASDIAKLTRIAHAAKRHWGYPERLIRLWKDDLTVTPEAVENDPIYCAIRGRKIAGFYALSCNGKTCEIEQMWVDPPCIGTGVGRRLFAHLLRRLRLMKVTRLRIASDPNAEGFYLRMGARRIGRVASQPSGRSLPLLVVRIEAGGLTRA
jgi:N-acetylglutamate synthase-like GNAT family acetyltransferase